MVPDRLQDWTVDHVVELANRGVYESDTFDLKETLPNPKDDPGKERLRKSCAAFANSMGGFIVFGVGADTSKLAPERIVGMDSSYDFPVHFGVFPSQCSPAVDWNFKNPALKLSSSRVIHIVHIPQSWRAPHAVGNPDAWTFPKRTNKGSEWMSYAEVQSMFLGYYEKRLKLQLLRAELQQIASDAGGMIIPPDQNDGKKYGLPTIELRMLETVLSDTYSITHSSPYLLDAMAQLRSLARMINNQVEVFRLEVALPTINKEAMVRQHNNSIRLNCQTIIELSGVAVELLNQLI